MASETDAMIVRTKETTAPTAAGRASPEKSEDGGVGGANGSSANDDLLDGVLLDGVLLDDSRHHPSSSAPSPSPRSRSRDDVASSASLPPRVRHSPHSSSSDHVSASS